MRLGDFILANTEPVLAEWEAYARRIWPRASTDRVALRDNAESMLRAAARDMRVAQSAEQQEDKSKGDGDAGSASAGVDVASCIHVTERVLSGFDLMSVVAEYRALCASVIRLWRESRPDPDRRDLDDLTRFNESIDQSLTEAVQSYTQQVDRSRQLFVAILSHDLRNPVNSMLLSAEVLLRTARLDAESVEMVSDISNTATALGRLIGDLLAFSGGGLGAGITVAPATTDLGDLCRSVVEEVCAAHPTRTVGCDVQGDLAGEWDASRVRQALGNLLDNALRHGDPAGPVKLSVEGGAGSVRVSVHNVGEPIPQAQIPTLFDPLVRSAWGEPPACAPRGIGLGLYVAREVATAHGGTIHVTSCEKDGTLFTVSLPRRTPQAAPIAA